MTCDITQIPYADIKPNSVLIVRMPEGTQNDLRIIEQLVQSLRPYISPTVAFLVMRDGTAVEHLSEELMNRAGWYRKTPSLTTP